MDQRGSAERGTKMTFLVDEYQYNGQGTAKAFCVHDVYGSRYWIPRSKVKIIDKVQSADDLTKNATLTINIPNWIIKNNQIPIFNLDELQLVR